MLSNVKIREINKLVTMYLNDAIDDENVGNALVGIVCCNLDVMGREMGVVKAAYEVKPISSKGEVA